MSWQIAVTPSGKEWVVEVHSDGTITAWTLSRLAPVGTSGPPGPGVVLRNPKNRKERDNIARFERALKHFEVHHG